MHYLRFEARNILRDKIFGNNTETLSCYMKHLKKFLKRENSQMSRDKMYILQILFFVILYR